MAKLRLISLLFALGTTAIATLAAPPVAEAVNCYQYNQGSCFYTWNASYGCCVPSHGLCDWICF